MEFLFFFFVFCLQPIREQEKPLITTRKWENKKGGNDWIWLGRRRLYVAYYTHQTHSVSYTRLCDVCRVSSFLYFIFCILNLSTRAEFQVVEQRGTQKETLNVSRGTDRLVSSPLPLPPAVKRKWKSIDASLPLFHSPVFLFLVPPVFPFSCVCIYIWNGVIQKKNGSGHLWHKKCASRLYEAEKKK